jgi:CRISPR system Cascade subunit CasB
MDNVKGFIYSKIQRLLDDTAWSKAMLAKLRRGIGKEPGSIPEIWEITLDGLESGEYMDKAVHTALTLFALHQQGKDKPMSVSNTEDDKRGNSLGGAVGKLIDDNNKEGIKRRFDAAITANDFTEFSHHARGLIQLLKASDIPIDYPAFAQTLYSWQFSESRDKVRLQWGKDYYYAQSKNMNDKEEKENG